MPVSYTTVSLMVMTLPDLGSITTLTSAHLYGYAEQAESLINAKIARLYSLPLTAPAKIDPIWKIATTVGIYYTLVQRLFTQERLNSSPWPDRYKEDMALLDQIATGEIPLVDGSGTIVGGRTDVAEVWSTTKDYEPTFHEGPWSLQIQDEDKIEDELDKRDLSGFRDRLT